MHSVQGHVIKHFDLMSKFTVYSLQLTTDLTEGYYILKLKYFSLKQYDTIHQLIVITIIPYYILFSTS